MDPSSSSSPDSLDSPDSPDSMDHMLQAPHADSMDPSSLSSPDSLDSPDSSDSLDSSSSSWQVPPVQGSLQFSFTLFLLHLPLLSIFAHFLQFQLSTHSASVVLVGV